MKFKKRFIFILLPFLLNSCTPFTVVSDQYWKDALSGIFENQAKIVKRGVMKGYSFKTKVVDLVSNETAGIESVTFKSGGLYLFSPLLSEAGQKKASVFPSSYFFCFTRDDVESPMDDNLVLIHGFSAISAGRVEETIENLVYMIAERVRKRVYKDIYLH